MYDVYNHIILYIVMLYTYLLIYKVYFTTWEDADLESEWSSYRLEQIIDVLLWHYSTCLAQHNVLRMHVRIYVPASIYNIYFPMYIQIHIVRLSKK